MASVRIWQKKRIVLDRLSFPQRQMVKLGTVGVAAVLNRVRAALGPDDGPAKPLTKRYAIRKSKLRLGNRRNLTFTGQMLRGLAVRTVSENTAKAAVAGGRRQNVRIARQRGARITNERLLNRDVAWANEQRQRWLVFSPKNRAAVMQAARAVFREVVAGLAVKK